MSLPAIVLAAGASLRLGKPKQLVEWHGQTLLERTVRAARDAGADPVVVVLGANAEEIRARVAFDKERVVLNADWGEGMASSIRTGLQAIDGVGLRPAGLLLLVCDQPYVTSAHLAGMLEAFDAHSRPAIVASVYNGVRGTPAILPQEMFAELKALRGDKGARGLLAGHSCPVVEVPLPLGEKDIDSPADLTDLL